MSDFLLRIKPYCPVVVFGLLLVSPLISTGLPIKKYTRLNEILLILVMAAVLFDHIARRKWLVPTNMEILILCTGAAVVVSNVYGHWCLDVPLGWIDFYQVFNVVLFACYFRLGTYFDYGSVRKRWLILLCLSILGLNLLAISQLLPWGFHHILPLYMPAGMIKSSGYESAFLHEGTIGRVPGIISSPTSFAIIMVVITLLLAGWILYMSIVKTKNKFLLHGLLTFSVFVLIMTFSRSGLLAFFVSFAFLLGVAHLIEKRSIAGICLSVLLAFVFYYFVILVPGETVVGIKKESLRDFRIHHTFVAQEEGSYAIAEQTPDGVHRYRISDFNNRIILWTMGLEKAMLSPILGWGAGNTAALEARRLGLEDTVRGFHGSHNEYIELTIQTGIVGLLLILSFFALVLNKSNRAVREGGSAFHVYVARTVQAIIAGIAVFCLFDGIWNNNIIPPILMILFGSLYAGEYPYTDHPPMRRISPLPGLGDGSGSGSGNIDRCESAAAKGANGK